MSEMVSTVIKAGRVCISGIFPEAFRISVMCGENRFLSNGISLSANALRILRTTDTNGAESLIPAHQSSPKQPIPSSAISNGVKETAANASRTGSASGYSPDKSQCQVHVFFRGEIAPDAMVIQFILCEDQGVLHLIGQIDGDKQSHFLFS